MPTAMRWPGTIQPGTVYNEMFSHYDLIPTLRRPVVIPTSSRNAVAAHRSDAKESPRKDFIYCNDDGQLVAVRVNGWKTVFNSPTCESPSSSTCARTPSRYESIEFNKWMVDCVFVQVPMQVSVAKWLESFKEFPVHQKPASFNLDAVIEKMERAGRARTNDRNEGASRQQVGVKTPSDTKRPAFGWVNGGRATAWLSQSPVPLKTDCVSGSCHAAGSANKRQPHRAAPALRTISKTRCRRIGLPLSTHCGELTRAFDRLDFHTGKVGKLPSVIAVTQVSRK